jgi:hypothetical protein
MDKKDRFNEFVEKIHAIVHQYEEDVDYIIMAMPADIFDKAKKSEAKEYERAYLESSGSNRALGMLVTIVTTNHEDLFEAFSTGIAMTAKYGEELKKFTLKTNGEDHKKPIKNSKPN